MSIAKKWYASKTIWFFGLYLLMNVAGLFGFADFTPTTDQAEIVGLVVALGGLILRFVTRQPVTT